MHPPPVERNVLPALILLHFKGACEYLDDLVSRIDAPQLIFINISYLNQPVGLQVAQLSKFIDRSVGPKLTLSRRAHVTFDNTWVSFDTHCHANDPTPLPTARIIASCEGIGRQVLHMAQVLSQFSAALPPSNFVDLGFEVENKWVRSTEGMDDIDWRHLLLQFSAVKTMYVLNPKLARHVAFGLEHMDAGTLPSLDLLFLAGQPPSFVEKFVAARKFSGRPVTVVDTETEFDERVKSYISK